MNRVFSKLWILGLTLLVVVWSWVSPAAAADLAAGASIFSANCAACHVGGGNLVNPAKTLKKDALEQYGMASLEAIKTQITQGKAAMPAFKGRLTSEQIDAVAAYVLAQADKNWSN